VPHLATTSRLRLEHTLEWGAPNAFSVQHGAWFAEAHRDGAAVVVSVDAPDPQGAVQELVASQDPLDDMFKDIVRSLTGLELATLFTPPMGSAETDPFP